MPDNRVVVSHAGVDAAVVALSTLEADRAGRAFRPIEVGRMGDHRGGEIGQLAGRTFLRLDVALLVEVVSAVDHVHGVCSWFHGASISRLFVRSDKALGNASPSNGNRQIRIYYDGSAPPTALTKGDGLEWSPAGLADGVAYVAANTNWPPRAAVASASGQRSLVGQGPPPEFAGGAFVTPRPVTFKAPDGTIVHGQLFQVEGAASQPGDIFVHGGPPRQMLLGWSYMRFYSNAYALNQDLASRGFAVLSVNYRLSIGYGWDFQNPEKGGPAGASE